MIEAVGIGSRSVTDDSLSVRKMHRVGLAPIKSGPVPSSLQNNCTVLGVELETSKSMIAWIVPDLDLLELSLLLADFKGGPNVP